MRAHFEVPLDPEAAAAIHAALAPEAAEGPEGSTTRLQLDGSLLRIDIEAEDLSTLRAAMHSALRLLDAAQRVLG